MCAFHTEGLKNAPSLSEDCILKLPGAGGGELEVVRSRAILGQTSVDLHCLHNAWATQSAGLVYCHSAQCAILFLTAASVMAVAEVLILLVWFVIRRLFRRPHSTSYKQMLCQRVRGKCRRRKSPASGSLVQSPPWCVGVE